MMAFLLVLAAAVPVGEKLTYRVKFGPLTAGTLKLEVKGIEEVQGESCYHLVSELRSNPGYSALFSLNDSIETWARVRDFVTLRTRKHVRESKYENEVEAGFDYSTGEVSYSDGSVLSLCGESRDLLGLWYYCRSLDLQVGDGFETYSHVDRRDYMVKVKVTGREQARTRAGAFNCLVVEIRSGGSAGSGVVYLSDDEARLPVVIKTRMPIGYLTAGLSAVEKGD